MALMTPFPSTNFFTSCSSGHSCSFLCLCVWRRHFSPLLPAHHRGRTDLRRRYTSLFVPTEPEWWALPPIDRQAEPAQESTPWAPCSIAAGYQLCRTLHTDKFHVCSILVLITCSTDAKVSTRCCYAASFSYGLVYAGVKIQATPPSLPQQCAFWTSHTICHLDCGGLAWEDLNSHCCRMDVASTMRRKTNSNDFGCFSN